MRTPIALRDIICKTQNLFVVTIVPLHGNLNGNLAAKIRGPLSQGVKNIWVQYGFGLVDVLNKPPHPAGECKIFLLPTSLINQTNVNAIIEK